MKHARNSIALNVMVLSVLVLALAGCQERVIYPEETGVSGTVAKERLFDYREVELSNGLKVITLEDFSCPIVSAQVWYHVGSKNEDPERQGFAHLFEHMMFKGTDRVGEEQHHRFISRVGGTNNAYTSFDKTVYLQTVAVNQLEMVLWLEAERMSFLKIDQASFDTERKVVEEELRQRENQPYGTLIKKFAAQLYKEHPYRWTPIGNLKHLRSASVSELRDFWTRYYVPNNATLIIIGAVKHHDAQRLAREYFGWIPRCPEPERVSVRESAITSPRSIVIDDENAPAGGAGFLWRTVPHGDRDEVVLDLLAEILGGGHSSRLYRDLVAERQLAVNALATTWNFEHDGVFIAGAFQSPASTDSGPIIDSIAEHIEKIKTDGVTEAELDKARNQMLKSLVTGNLTIDSKASLLGNAALIKGDTSRVNSMFDEVRAIDRSDLRRVANEYLGMDKAVTVTVKRNLKGTLAAVAKSLFSAKNQESSAVTTDRELVAPAPGRKGVVRPIEFPDEAPFGQIKALKATPKFSSQTLANGIKVMVVPNHEVPYVSITLGMKNGAWTEAKTGAASMAMRMLTKGTSTYSEGELAEELERLAISLGGFADKDTSKVVANCLAEYTPRAVELMADVILHPVFDEQEFKKLRKQILTSLAIETQTPEYIADKEFRKKLFGDHPYARTVTGEIDDVKALSAEDLKLWWEKFVRPDQATIIFAGDINEETAVGLVEGNLSGWNSNVVETGLILPEIPQPVDTHIYIIDQPESLQSEIRFGQIGITRHDQPEYFISRIVSSYFGWSFDGRLMSSIRSEKGLTYDIWGSYIADMYAGRFEVNTSTKTASTAEMIGAVLDEIVKLRSIGPSDSELNDSKSYFAGSFVRNRETPQQVAKDLWLIESQSLQGDYLEQLLAKIADTTAQECLQFAAATVDPDKMLIVVAGDAEKIKDELERIAPVTVIAPPKAE